MSTPQPLKIMSKNTPIPQAEQTSGKPSLNILTNKDVLRELEISRFTLARMVGRGEIPVVKVGRSNRYRREDILAYLAANTSTHSVQATA